MSPATTTTAGFSRFTAAASTSPTYLPLSRIIRRASASPPWASSTTSRRCRTDRPCCCSACTTAQPPAMASTQPVSPHRHGRPWAAAILLCPNSPAACAAPRCNTPPATMPAPRPLEALMTSTSSYPWLSTTAIALASLSSTTGTPERRGSSEKYGRSSTPSQPRRIGESRLQPRSRSTVPGRLSPTP